MFKTSSNDCCEKCKIDPAVELRNHITGVWRSWMITVAVKLDIADHLAKEPRTADELANLADANPATLFRLLRALESIGIFKRDANEKWTLTPMAALLTSNEENSLKHSALLFVEDENLVWQNLYQAIKEGNSVIERLYGEPYWKFLESRPERIKNLKACLKENVHMFCSRIPEIYDFKQFKHIIDLGGNDGTFLSLVLNSAPNATGAVYDLEYAKEIALKNIEKNGLNGKCSFITGSFLESVPEGADCYTIKQTLHNWDDENAVKILSNIRKQMKSGTRLLIINTCLPESGEPHFNKLWDLYTFIFVNGQERTRKEYNELIERAGLRLNRVIVTGQPVPDIIEVVV